MRALYSKVFHRRKTPSLEERFRRLAGAILTLPGATSADLRAAVADRAAAASTGGAEGAAPLAAPLDGYVRKVAREAYRIADLDAAELGRAGYGEDAIFELTLSAALGAALARLERGLLALRKAGP